ncbi:hypothetical protein AbraIFM66951_004790 [Aspergillus brasiliensis]|nr:hypothetical protein AbraIFM66951_004790 [Aspergillus brasiliensis]
MNLYRDSLDSVLKTDSYLECLNRMELESTWTLAKQLIKGWTRSISSPRCAAYLKLERWLKSLESKAA